MKKEILDVVTEHYLNSRDFNGISLFDLALKISGNEINSPLKDLIEEDKIEILYSKYEANTHILRTGFPPKKIQLEEIDKAEVFHTCIYPSAIHLNEIVDRSNYIGKPYELCLALGEPQLNFRSFDLNILEIYRNDPRYYYTNDDINGSISVRKEYYESDNMPEYDQVLLQTFGFSYDRDLNRGVATFLRYLADLSPEHQQIWKVKELIGDYELHPDYYRNTILGAWGVNIPICSAFINELFVINQMADAMGRPPFFRADYGKYGEDRPSKFSFLVRPTLEEFNNFVLLLDKLLSDNINKDFFQDEVSYEDEKVRADDKIVVTNKGTLQILDSWVRTYFRPVDWNPWNETIQTLRNVRKLRQKPAHAVDENVFDQKYFKEQRELIIGAYEAIRNLRLLLSNHPDVRKANIEIPEWLKEGKIWTF